jgi:hypothetical protein
MERGVFDKFIGLQYEFNAGPGDVSNKLNCQKLVHKIYTEAGYSLPLDLLSKEIFENKIIFKNIDSKEERKILDIYIFGKKEEIDSKKFHLAIFTGLYTENNDPLLIHASGRSKKVIFTSLSEFLKYKNGCEELKAIKRLKTI